LSHLSHEICTLLDFKWEEADTEDLLYLETSRFRIISQEPFDISCTVSYYYFSKGSHLTLKDLSDPLHLEVDLRAMKNVSLLETVEVMESEEGGDDENQTLLPVKRTIVGRGLTLPSAGDYEISCYGLILHNITSTNLILLYEIMNHLFICI